MRSLLSPYVWVVFRYRVPILSWQVGQSRTWASPEDWNFTSARTGGFLMQTARKSHEIIHVILHVNLHITNVTTYDTTSFLQSTTITTSQWHCWQQQQHDAQHQQQPMTAQKTKTHCPQTKSTPKDPTAHKQWPAPMNGNRWWWAEVSQLTSPPFISLIPHPGATLSTAMWQPDDEQMLVIVTVRIS